MSLTKKLSAFLFVPMVCLLIWPSEQIMSQEIESWSGRSARLALKSKIEIDSVSINPKYFAILQLDGDLIDPNLYQVDFAQASIYPSSELLKSIDSIQVRYLRYPDFLTRPYSALNPKLILPAQNQVGKIFKLEQNNFISRQNPFSGLNVQGNIVRGITLGNNQNAVVNSQLDLQITGALSDKVQITASLQDSNLPGENGGYTQSLEEFDQLFVSLEADKWQIRAGDVDLINRKTFFGQFTKKIQGMHAMWKLDHKDGSKSDMFASAGLVRGVFKRSIIQGQEGNQGPYKLLGTNGEALILMISGSERIYVNGMLLERGENADYIMDYNAGELRFNSTYPITSNMRITAEYQVTERNYTRFIAFSGGEYSSEHLNIGAYLYSEQDDKNQPLQQNFTEVQKEILLNAGDDPAALLAPSEQIATYSENQILYKKELIDGQEAFVFSNNPEDDLYQVRFNLVGANQGDYIIDSQTSINKIFQYVAPINGQSQGNYSPVILLTPAQKMQLAGAFIRYHKESSQLYAEFSASDTDLNLYSSLGDQDNDGFASLIEAEQILAKGDSLWRISAFVKYNNIDKNYRSPELPYQVEFNRDWNLSQTQIIRDQNLVMAGSRWESEKIGSATYQFDQLKTQGNYLGQKHNLNNNLQGQNWWYRGQLSNLNTQSDLSQSTFARVHQSLGITFGKSWWLAKYQSENNKIKDSVGLLDRLSQKFIEYEAAAGIGDSTAIFGQLGWRYRETDSVVMSRMERTGVSRDLFLKGQFLNSAKTKLSGFAQYRNLSASESTDPNQKSLNLRLNFTQNIWNNNLRLATSVEANNGKLPQQEFTYIEVEPGQGTYTWIDYNEDGIQDLDEFEIGQYQDQAAYVRLLLPNQNFIDIQRSALTQIITWQNPSWQNRNGWRKILSHFFSQTAFVVDRSAPKSNQLFTNPFASFNDNDLALQLNFKQSFFFNRSKQNYTTAYIYQKSQNNQLVALGLQKSTLEQHQLLFDHKIKDQILVHLTADWSNRNNRSENFTQRNFNLSQQSIRPKLSYFWGENSRVNIKWASSKKENQLENQEKLSQNTLGISCTLAQADRMSLTAEINAINNKFIGSPLSSAGYLMLEGLQPGKNLTWNLLWQKRINDFLDLNLSYFGRQSAEANTIHTGSMQLRAFF